MDDYELLDVGAGARLERFGPRIVARAHPTAVGERGDPAAWSRATMTWDPDRGWRGDDPAEPWTIEIEGLTLELRPTVAGQVGLFPEQAGSWAWLRRVVSEGVAPGETPRVLNLFAATGIGSLVAAAAGASVVHVDGSRPTVAWARRNADLSGLADRPIRWLIDDAVAFVSRELRRGRRYDGIVLDPPSYGHGAGGRAWRLEADLGALLADCAVLADAPTGFILLTAHTPGFGPERLAAELAGALGVPPRRIEAGALRLTARSGRTLDLGAFARWQGTR